jgi:hypothetical protein
MNDVIVPTVTTVINKTKNLGKNLFYAGFLKATEEKSRIGI